MADKQMTPLAKARARVAALELKENKAKEIIAARKAFDAVKAKYAKAAKK